MCMTPQMPVMYARALCMPEHRAGTRHVNNRAELAVLLSCWVSCAAGLPWGLKIAEI